MPTWFHITPPRLGIGSTGSSTLASRPFHFTADPDERMSTRARTLRHRPLVDRQYHRRIKRTPLNRNGLTGKWLGRGPEARIRKTTLHSEGLRNPCREGKSNANAMARGRCPRRPAPTQKEPDQGVRRGRGRPPHISLRPCCSVGPHVNPPPNGGGYKPPRRMQSCPTGPTECTGSSPGP
jgi:hypothetical protein